MTDILMERGRGRPRQFDLGAAIAAGQKLFHEQGYDSVGVAAITDHLQIKAPSFYAAFGSKAGYLARVLECYASSVLPLSAILVPGRAPDEALSDLLHRAATLYATHPQARGCLALETARAADPAGAALAKQVTEQRRNTIQAFVAATHPTAAAQVVDIVVVTMSGLSAYAREGWPADRLQAVADAAMIGIKKILMP